MCGRIVAQLLTRDVSRSAIDVAGNRSAVYVEFSRGRPHANIEVAVTDQGLPLGKVFVGTDIQYGGQ